METGLGVARASCPCVAGPSRPCTDGLNPRARRPWDTWARRPCHVSYTFSAFSSQQAQKWSDKSNGPPFRPELGVRGVGSPPGLGGLRGVGVRSLGWGQVLIIYFWDAASASFRTLAPGAWARLFAWGILRVRRGSPDGRGRRNWEAQTSSQDL